MNYHTELNESLSYFPLKKIKIFNIVLGWAAAKRERILLATKMKYLTFLEITMFYQNKKMYFQQDAEPAIYYWCTRKQKLQAQSHLVPRRDESSIAVGTHSHYLTTVTL